jgi:hypothetical protein
MHHAYWDVPFVGLSVCVLASMRDLISRLFMFAVQHMQTVIALLVGPIQNCWWAQFKIAGRPNSKLLVGPIQNCWSAQFKIAGGPNSKYYFWFIYIRQ